MDASGRQSTSHVSKQIGQRFHGDCQENEWPDPKGSGKSTAAASLESYPRRTWRSSDRWGWKTMDASGRQSTSHVSKQIGQRFHGDCQENEWPDPKGSGRSTAAALLESYLNLGKTTQTLLVMFHEFVYVCVLWMHEYYGQFHLQQSFIHSGLQDTSTRVIFGNVVDSSCP